MILSENTLFIDITSIVNIDIDQSIIIDMSGIYMNANIPNTISSNSIINIIIILTFKPQN